MRKMAITSVLCIVGLMAVQMVHAQGFGQNIAFSARVGSLGPGLEVTTTIIPHLNARVGGHYFSYSQSQDFTDDDDFTVQADADVKLSSASLLVDWLPFQGGFRVSTGFVLNLNEATAAVLPQESYNIDGHDFTPERLGTMDVNVGHKSSVQPYLGIGFGNAVREGKHFGFVFDLGMLYTDSPAVEMTGTGMIAPTAKQAKQIEEDLKGIKLYPVLSLGLSYNL